MKGIVGGHSSTFLSRTQKIYDSAVAFLEEAKYNREGSVVESKAHRSADGGKYAKKITYFTGTLSGKTEWAV